MICMLTNLTLFKIVIQSDNFVCCYRLMPHPLYWNQLYSATNWSSYLEWRKSSLHQEKKLTDCFNPFLTIYFISSRWSHVSDSLCYLSNDSLSGLIILVEEVVGLNEKLAGVFLNLGHPLLPQQHRVNMRDDQARFGQNLVEHSQGGQE